MGIKTQLHAYPAEGLGGLTRGVSPLEMANAYATIADGGWRNKPIAIRKVDVPRRARRQPRQAAPAPRVRRRRHGRGDEDPRAERQERHRLPERDADRLPGGRQDRHDRQLHRRLVRRLHAAPGDLGLGRPRDLARADARRRRRHDPGEDLGPVHEAGPRASSAASSPSRRRRSSRSRSSARYSRGGGRFGNDYGTQNGAGAVHRRPGPAASTGQGGTGATPAGAAPGTGGTGATGATGGGGTDATGGGGTDATGGGGDAGGTGGAELPADALRLAAAATPPG